MLAAEHQRFNQTEKKKDEKRVRKIAADWIEKT